MQQPTPNYAVNKNLKGLASDELFDLAEKVRDLRQHPAFLTAGAITRDAREAMVKGMTSGATKSQADYARIAGFIAGLDEFPTTLDLIVDAAERRQRELEKEASDESRRREESPWTTA